LTPFKIFMAGSFSLGALFLTVPTAPAEPLTPAEQEYLIDVRQALEGDPDQAKGDTQLLADGYRACEYRAAGHESIELAGVSGAAAAYGLTHLCPAYGDF